MRFVLLFFGLAAQPLAAQQPTGTDAYHDARAEELVRLARERRQLVDRSITHYQATAKERISVGLRTRLRDRLFYRRETASRIDWQRGGPIDITVLGAREVAPVFTPKPQVPDDLDEFLPRLAFDPMDAESLIRIDSTGLRHPLSAGAEVHYRYRTGDSVAIRFSDRDIQLIELRVEPRRRDVQLMSGSFWIDDATHSVVQVTFKLAKDYDFEMRSSRDGDRGEVRMADREQMRAAERDSSRKSRGVPLPGFMKPMRAELQYVTIEFGLMQLHWWLPRLIAAEGLFQMGAIKVPMHYERSYSYDRVVGDTTAALIAKSAITDDSTAAGPCRRGIWPRAAINGGDEYAQRYRERRDSARERTRARTDSLIAAGDTARARRRMEREACSSLYRLTIGDSVQLLASEELPPSIYGDLEALTSSAELGKLAKQLERLAEAPWQLRRPSLAWGLGGNGLIRYNKVEALSVGAKSEFDFGRLRADATARFGVADLQPKAELGITRSTNSSLTRLGVFRRLGVMDEASGPGSITSSLNALMFGVDDRDYFRSTGLELSRRPNETSTQWYQLKLFAEQQRAVSNETDFSLRHSLNTTHFFRPNRPAERADQLGAQLTLRASGGQNPASFRWSGELTGMASAGTFDFSRESLLLQVGFPLPFKLVGALEGEAGRSTGPVPTQSLWYLGGSRSVRGYDIGSISGDAFWRGRAEIATAFPGARVVGFTDLGWAGDRHDIADRASLLSVGIGASFLDGILRFDLARALRANRGWKLHLSVDGIL